MRRRQVLEDRPEWSTCPTQCGGCWYSLWNSTRLWPEGLRGVVRAAVRNLPDDWQVPICDFLSSDGREDDEGCSYTLPYLGVSCEGRVKGLDFVAIGREHPIPAIPSHVTVGRAVYWTLCGWMLCNTDFQVGFARHRGDWEAWVLSRRELLFERERMLLVRETGDVRLGPRLAAPISARLDAWDAVERARFDRLCKSLLEGDEGSSWSFLASEGEGRYERMDDKVRW